MLPLSWQTQDSGVGRIGLMQQGQLPEFRFHSRCQALADTGSIQAVLNRGFHQPESIGTS
jgi:hypothetical protein